MYCFEEKHVEIHKQNRKSTTKQPLTTQTFHSHFAHGDQFPLFTTGQDNVAPKCS